MLVRWEKVGNLPCRIVPRRARKNNWISCAEGLEMSCLLQHKGATLSAIAYCPRVTKQFSACARGDASGTTRFDLTSCAALFHVGQSEAANASLDADRKCSLSRKDFPVSLVRECRAWLLQSAFAAVPVRLPSSAVQIR